MALLKTHYDPLARPMQSLVGVTGKRRLRWDFYITTTTEEIPENTNRICLLIQNIGTDILSVTIQNTLFVIARLSAGQSFQIDQDFPYCGELRVEAVGAGSVSALTAECTVED